MSRAVHVFPINISHIVSASVYCDSFVENDVLSTYKYVQTRLTIVVRFSTDGLTRITLVNVYVDLVVFTRIVGTS